jgi:hypothetical protein
MAASELEKLLSDNRRNAAVAWALITLLAGTAVGIVIATGPLWSVFALGLVILGVIPPLAYRSPYVMLPWEILLVAALPIIGLALGNERLSSQFTVYFAVAAVALVVVVELNAFTPVRLSPGFAVVLVVVATLAAAALWGLLQWGFDVYLGTNYITTNDDLMYEWIYSAAAGVGAGLALALYFRRRGGKDDPRFEEISDAITEESGGERV